MKARISAALTVAVLLSAGVPGFAQPVWTGGDGEPQVAFAREIRCCDLKPSRSLLGRIGRFLGGGDEEEHLHRPCDVLAFGDVLYVTFQDRPVLIEADLDGGRYRQFRCEELPLVSPIALCAGAGGVLVTDSGNGAVYRLADGRLQPFITGLQRPTGIACGPGDTILVVDTGAHAVKIFDARGVPVGSFGGRAEDETGFNFPTFAAADGDLFWINDTLNFRIVALSGGVPARYLGREGAVPGGFVRAKGVAVDGRGRVWVVDAMQDNVQVFGRDGNLELVIGSRGGEPGTFWSPCGICIDGDRVYLADTFNDRIQVLRLLGGKP